MKLHLSDADFRTVVSLLTQERGLKPERAFVQVMAAQSLLTQERGLKHIITNPFRLILWSLLTQERGLKPYPYPYLCLYCKVAPHAGARIETST